MCIRTEILTVEDLRRNVLSKKMCFHFHDYPIELVKNMRRKVLLITLTIFIFLLNKVLGMAYLDGNTHLDLLYQKSLGYQHHQENYQTSLLD